MTLNLWILDKRIIWLVLTCLVGLFAYFSPIALLLLIGFVVVALGMFTSPLVSLIMMLVLAPLRTLIATESPVQIPLDIGQIAFIVFLVFWVFHYSLRKHRRVALPISSFSVAIALFAIVSGLTVFTAYSPAFWLTEWLKWITILVLIVLVANIADNNDWQWISFGLVMSGLANAIVGLYIFFGGSGADHLLINERFFRAFGTFGQPNPFGGFMALLLPIALMSVYGLLVHIYQYWRSKHNWHVISFIKLSFYALASLLMFGGLVASWSRGAWLGFLVSLAVMAFAVPRKLWQSIAFSLTIFAILIGLWFGGFIPQSISQRVTGATEDLFTFSDMRGVDISTVNYASVERLAHWQAALNMAYENPWLGVGLGNYEVAYPDYRLANWEYALGHAHNYYLNILAETGIIGFLAYMMMWVSIAWSTWRIRLYPDNFVRSLAIGLLGTWSYLAVHSMFDNLYVNNIFLHLGVMLGLLAVFSRQIHQSIQWD